MRIEDYITLPVWFTTLLSNKHLSIALAPFSVISDGKSKQPQFFNIACGQTNRCFDTALFASDDCRQVDDTQFEHGVQFTVRCKITGINLAVLVGRWFSDCGYVDYLASASKILEQYQLPTNSTKYAACVALTAFSVVMTRKFGKKHYRLSATEASQAFYHRLGYKALELSPFVATYCLPTFISPTPIFPDFNFYLEKQCYEPNIKFIIYLQRQQRRPTLINELKNTKALLDYVNQQLLRPDLNKDLRTFFCMLSHFYSNIMALTGAAAIQLQQAQSFMVSALAQLTPDFFMQFSDLKLLQLFFAQNAVPLSDLRSVDASGTE